MVFIRPIKGIRKGVFPLCGSLLLSMLSVLTLDSRHGGNKQWRYFVEGLVMDVEAVAHSNWEWVWNNCLGIVLRPYCECHGSGILVGLYRSWTERP